MLARDLEPVATTERQRYLELLDRRLQGEPYAYLVGEREFFGRPFHVDRRVLVPRPETEHLVEAALSLAPAPGARLVDVGTGSGCIALTLALERPDLRLVATDLSLDALRVAARNRARFALDHRVALLAGDLTAALRLGRVEMVVSNPPYVSTADAADLAPEVREHEPALALFSEGDGLAAVRRLLRAGEGLGAGAWIVLEIGAGQLDAVRTLARPCCELSRVVDDYAGIPRIVVLRRR